MPLERISFEGMFREVARVSQNENEGGQHQRTAKSDGYDRHLSDRRSDTHVKFRWRLHTWGSCGSADYQVLEHRES